MVIDSSAVLAILFDEPERFEFSRLVEADSIRLISAITYVEAAVVWDCRKVVGARPLLDQWLRAAAFDIVPVDVEQAEIARSAYALYGKGLHAAGLNLGDCFSYALAKQSGQPLLYKGNDFTQTDVRPAVPLKG